MRGDETRSEIEAKLAERRARLKEMEDKGVEALSSYDRKLGVMMYGGEEGILEFSKQLVRNHISYHEKQLAEAPAEQGKLF